MRNKLVAFDELLGKTLIDIKVDQSTVDDEIRFYCSDGTEYRMFHDQDCCERVDLEDICGELSDLIGCPITMAEAVSQSGDLHPTYDSDDSYTWTFYKLATNKGYVTLRWYGTSNGYYSERVDFAQVLCDQQIMN